jgi:hypothetical protein
MDSDLVKYFRGLKPQERHRKLHELFQDIGIILADDPHHVPDLNVPFHRECATCPLVFRRGKN